MSDVMERTGGALLTPTGDRLLLPDGTFWQPQFVPIERALPRIALAPRSFAFSSGFEAIDLAESAGLILDDWQKLCLILGLGETELGRWASSLVALIVARQNGKGSILEALELFWLFGTGEKLIGHSAHEYKTALEAFRRVLFLIENTDSLRKKVKKVINANGEEGIELLTGQRLRFMARSKGAGRGFTFYKLVWDEAYALTREQQDAQLPTMSAVPNPQIWVTSSPPLTSESGAVLFQLRQQAAALGKLLTFLDYGLEGSLDKLDLIDLDDHEGWKLSNPAEAVGRITLDVMERERAAMGDTGFARERLCVWPPDLTQGFGVITQEQWNLLLDQYSGTENYEGLPATPEYWPEPSLPISDMRYQVPPTRLLGRPCIAVHVGPRAGGRATGAIGVAQERFDGRRHIELIKQGRGTDWLIFDLVKLHLATGGLIVIDPGSPAGSILADLEQALRAAGLEPDEALIKMQARDVAQAFGMIYDAASSATEETRSVVHLGQSELTLAVGGAVTRKIGDGLAWDAAASTTDITGLISVTYALWGLAKAPEPVEDEPLVVWA